MDDGDVEACIAHSISKHEDSLSNIESVRVACGGIRPHAHVNIDSKLQWVPSHNQSTTWIVFCKYHICNGSSSSFSRIANPENAWNLVIILRKWNITRITGPLDAFLTWDTSSCCCPGNNKLVRSKDSASNDMSPPTINTVASALLCCLDHLS